MFEQMGHPHEHPIRVFKILVYLLYWQLYYAALFVACPTEQNRLMPGMLRPRYVIYQIGLPIYLPNIICDVILSWIF